MTSLLTWCPALSVDHGELDGQHRRMTELINRICARGLPMPAEGDAVAVLDELERLARLHFAHEEAVVRQIWAATADAQLRRTLPPAILAHDADHRAGLGQLQQLRQAAVAGAPTAAGLSMRLKTWFVDHAVGCDAGLKTIIQSV